MFSMNLLDGVNIWPGDWAQFFSGLVTTIIGTVVGIFVPFWLSARHEKKNKRNRAMEILGKLKGELLGVPKQFENLKENEQYINPIKIPEWNSLLNTNEIELLSCIKTDKRNQSVENSGDLIKTIFNIYDLLEEYNQWSNCYTDKAAGGRTKAELSPIKKGMDQLRTDVIASKENKKSILYVVDLIESCVAKAKEN